MLGLCRKPTGRLCALLYYSNFYELNDVDTNTFIALQDGKKYNSP